MAPQIAAPREAGNFKSPVYVESLNMLAHRRWFTLIFGGQSRSPLSGKTNSFATTGTIILYVSQNLLYY